MNSPNTRKRLAFAINDTVYSVGRISHQLRQRCGISIYGNNTHTASVRHTAGVYFASVYIITNIISERMSHASAGKAHGYKRCNNMRILVFITAQS